MSLKNPDFIEVVVNGTTMTFNKKYIISVLSSGGVTIMTVNLANRTQDFPVSESYVNIVSQL